MLTLVKKTKKQLVIKPTQGSWGTRDIGRTIYSMIKEKAFMKKQNSSWVLDMTQSSLEGIRKNNIDSEITSRREIDRDLYSLKHASMADIVYIDRL
ncbi:12916_t:CDS:2 [Dentiscutata erythropus]|uniref:12916_t:CDS:1 n=1 Tax=Dentiscutata erythropus TaxID=1348616 RepID=A0A9N8WJX6_9GLOM|nr:12916_t:CDS:2 [Dentiscutata erythropus]